MNGSLLHAGYCVVRWRYTRAPGVDASGIGLVPKDNFGDWSKGQFFYVVCGPGMQTHVKPFALSWKGLAEQKELKATFNDKVQVLVFAEGECVEIESRDVPTLQSLLAKTKPIWDEHSILKSIQVDPRCHGGLCTPNTFGTWADVVLNDIQEKSENKMGWKTVGRDPRLLPQKNKVLRLINVASKQCDLKTEEEQEGLQEEDVAETVQMVGQPVCLHY